jgi:hypothetical protein
MLNLGSSGSRTKKTPDRPLQDCPGARGLYPSGKLTRTLWRRNPTEPDYDATSAWGSGACPSPQAPDLQQHSGPPLGSCPASDAGQGPDAKKTPLKLPRLGGSPALPLGHGIAGHFPNKVTHGACTRRQSFPAASSGSEATGPTHQHLEPTSFTAKKTPEGPPGGGWSNPTQPDMQSVRTKQSDDAQGFFGSTTPPWSTTRRYKALLDSSACRP